MRNYKLPIFMTPSESVWGVRYLLFQYFFLPSLLALALRFLWPAAADVHLDFLYFSVNFIAVIWIFHRFLWNSIRYTMKHLYNCLITAVSGFLIYQVLIYSISLTIILLYPGFFNINDASIAVTAQDNFLLMAAGTVILVPIVEETLYRGIVFGLLRRRSRILAYGISTLIFCGIHVAGYWGSYEPLHLLICFVQYIPAGLVLGWAYERSGSIYVPTLIHMAVNAIGILSAR